MVFFTRLMASQMRTLPPLPECDLHGRTLIITGANCGIGLEIAHHLAGKAPSLIILAVRSAQKGNIARLEVLSRLPKVHQTTVEVWPVDLADFSSVIAFGERCKSLDRIDGVAMNAGILGGGTREMTKDGHEIVTQVNDLSQIFLSLLLTPMLLSTGQSEIPGRPHFAPRIIFTGSLVAEVSPTKSFDVANPLAGLDGEKRYRAADRYNESKLVLHALSRHFTSLQPNLVITDVAPGFVWTPLYREAPGLVVFLARRIGRSAEAGARNCSMAMLTLTQSEDFIHDCKPAKIHAPWLDTSDGKAFSANLWRDCCREFERLHPGLLAAAGVEQ